MDPRCASRALAGPLFERWTLKPNLAPKPLNGGLEKEAPTDESDIGQGAKFAFDAGKKAHKFGAIAQAEHKTDAGAGVLGGIAGTLSAGVMVIRFPLMGVRTGGLRTVRNSLVLRGRAGEGSPSEAGPCRAMPSQASQARAQPSRAERAKPGAAPQLQTKK